ncbi:16S rRNA (cytosine(1402)-N(4))-methyltransferase RsmH [Cellulomonas fimi]|uniref:Ribosomal RNA small subunit methyltransferase H n=1 Tax=Cellulomonas fimi (strain ATCC 484 / DSM 20113 / JCM 1341 / CCUG 24087 / LMG 16345 / NBRC 15513 / NCIMB 8980 / NCTC 7547 / NRS-133) TaxID=590998 RepID=F4H7Q6_CELFA|nr:16S rRNA (cytosine(1402)-N(4))-methyltransferase RsmH [Cellulomonas fimi]AEE45740.1 S-adenosyl-methyltransferase MraW [Cellulomonas fimi ATCC 484]NNH08388.1 16S rRNA (cytosine(1402)-N(4))-methyltransferase RsmH [Cellulomonas fimi]VEH30457.1 Ribosomal RNA small subunit methyltransferase H [Cellulomonas fimi]
MDQHDLGDAATRHTPVLLQRCLDLLAPALAADGSVMVDSTLGMGGHTEGVLRAFPHVRVVGIDRDPQALALAGRRLAPFGDRFTGVHAVYDEIGEVLDGLGIDHVQGVLMDLGVSSLQLDERERGFSYAHDAPLDMRMDASRGQTAADVVNGYDERDLARVLRVYGEERFAARIARSVVRAREKAPLTRTGELVDLVRASIPAATRKTGGHPAKRTFQALRIEVNGELEVLERALPASVEALAVGGRIVVEAYHSLEDRLVKRTLAAGATSSAPPDLPVEPETHAPYLRLVTRGAEEADEAELARNPRAQSVRLRAAERIRPTPDHLRGPQPGRRAA